MKTGERWSCWKSLIAVLGPALPLLLLQVCGCAKDRASVEKHLMEVRHSAQRQEGVPDSYRVGCPDVLELHVYERPEMSGRYEIGADGKIELGGDYGKVRIEGRTLSEIGKLMAAEVGVSPEHVQVRVSDFRSAHVLLFGEVTGLQRSIPYRGQETVLDLLQRVGGITVGAEPKDVYVVRPHLGESHRPEVFHVDLQAIVVKQDLKTNPRILPFDQIYVGQTRQAKVERALPPWLRSMYQAIWDTRPHANPGPRREDPIPSRWMAAKKELPEAVAP
jgi:protein involved in polysaccharide export with SLBB domain